MGTPLTVDLSGPFFKGDPGETMLKNLQKMMQALADEGASTARANFLSGSASRRLVSLTGDRVADHVVGRVTARPSKGGRHWVSAAVVQVYNEGLDGPQTRSLMAAGAIVARKTRAISSLTRTIRSSRAVLAANLTAGIE